MTNAELMKIAITIQFAIKTNIATRCSKVSRELMRHPGSLSIDDLNNLQRIIFSSLNCSDDIRDPNDIKSLLDQPGICYPNISKLYRYTIPTTTSLYRDLKFLADKYDSLSLDLANYRLKVTTHPIILLGADLGRFSIDLDIKTLGKHWIGEVIVNPLEPNYASGSGYVHPHVSDDRHDVCLGDGESALISTIRDYRICDYFEIVSSILNTYNSHGPFKPIEYWIGQECTDCGTHYSDSEHNVLGAGICTKCDREYCSKCVTKCCSGLKCGNCRPPSFNCRSCNFIMCSNCITVCKGCDTIYCSDRFNDCMKYHYHPPTNEESLSEP